MSHHRNLVVMATVVVILIFSTASVQSGQPDKPDKPGKPGLPECLAKVAELEATIVELQAQIVKLQALLDSYKNYAPVAKTGQKYVERSGDDGDLQKGVEWPVPRFTDHNDGTVTDNLTRLVWLKDANCFGDREYGDWYSALTYCNTLTAQTGSCGLSDPSVQGDWRLPNRNELLSLHDINYVYPDLEWPEFLPTPNPFINVQGGYYWTSSTSFFNFGSHAWIINIDWDGDVSQEGGKAAGDHNVWRVRDPN